MELGRKECNFNPKVKSMKLKSFYMRDLQQKWYLSLG
jgi:hypothetical protein